MIKPLYIFLFLILFQFIAKAQSAAENKTIKKIQEICDNIDFDTGYTTKYLDTEYDSIDHLRGTFTGYFKNGKLTKIECGFNSFQSSGFYGGFSTESVLYIVNDTVIYGYTEYHEIGVFSRQSLEGNYCQYFEKGELIKSKYCENPNSEDFKFTIKERDATFKYPENLKILIRLLNTK